MVAASHKVKEEKAEDMATGEFSPTTQAMIQELDDSAESRALLAELVAAKQQRRLHAR